MSLAMPEDPHIRELERTVRARNEHFHPLEMIPVFRRWPHSFVRDLVYTFIWNLMFGIVFAGIGIMFGARPSWQMFTEMAVFCNTIGYSIHFLFYVLARSSVERWVIERGKLVMTAYYVVVPILGVFFGMLLAGLFLGRDVARWFGSVYWMAAIAVNSFIISIIIALIYFWREKSLVSDMRVAAERERIAQAEREATLANLRALQAQIEPHFLFNTLANVVGLIHPDPNTAKLMLERFIVYLRASLTASRESSTTLGADFELMKNFLGILQIRMGDRLRTRVELPADLAAFPIPPMLLQPLVENALKHGLEPKVEGGELLLRARREDAHLLVEVVDTGVGFSGATSNGIGLKNVRERLEKLFPGVGALRIEENSPTGTRAVVVLPARDPQSP